MIKTIVFSATYNEFSNIKIAASKTGNNKDDVKCTQQKIRSVCGWLWVLFSLLDFLAARGAANCWTRIRLLFF